MCHYVASNKLHGYGYSYGYGYGYGLQLFCLVIQENRMREKLRLQWESKQKSIKEEEVKLGACFFLSLYEPSRAKNLSFLNDPLKIFFYLHKG